MDDEDLKSARILIVDDEPVNVRLLERLLRIDGFHHLTSTTDARDVVGLYRSVAPDLILLDLRMPHLDGFAVLHQLATEIPATSYVPILVLTADATLETKRQALEAGAKDFLTKPFEHFEVLLRIRNLLDTRRAYGALERQNQSLEVIVRERTERLLQSEKVATMGSLLAGVAHELNNPLAVLSGQAQLLEQVAVDRDMARRAQKIGRASDRCVRIVRNFLALARQRPPERTAVRLHDVVSGAVELLAYELRTDGVEVTIDVPDTLPTLLADPHQLHQVLVNLIANAHQAQRRQPGRRSIAVTARHDATRDRLRVEVLDTGPGMSAEVQAKIFEPFFTTKPPGEGTGLGLPLCRGVIEEHGGTITVDSVEGQGTTFVIELPVTAPTVPAEEPHTVDASPVIQPGTILIVDDEADVAEVVAEALQLDGHATDVAQNGAIALQLLANRVYDLVVSDTKMPVLDGEALWAEIAQRYPRLRARMMFLTGDVLSREKREFLERTGAPYLAKPCDLIELRRLAGQVLAGPVCPA